MLQPMRHLVVLRAARRQWSADVQKASVSSEAAWSAEAPPQAVGSAAEAQDGVALPQDGDAKRRACVASSGRTRSVWRTRIGWIIILQ